MEFEEGFGNIILVDNLPVIPNDSFEKLEGAIRRIYGEIGLWMPVDPETQKTLGYCFIEFNTPQVTCVCVFNLLFFSFSFDCLCSLMFLRTFGCGYIVSY